MNLDAQSLHAALMHELKNNLGLLSMTIDSIPVTGAVEHDKVRDDARLLCQRVMERLQQSLLVYRAQHGPMIPKVDAYSPRDVAEEMLETVKSLARGRLEVQMDVAEHVPEIWFFDRNLVEMALLNAIHNSLDYARHSVRIEVSQEGSDLVFTVQDDSEGYPAHVLEAFSRNTSYRSTGTGLGLQFARMVADAHDNRGRTGALQLSNRNGARFSLYLP